VTEMVRINPVADFSMVDETISEVSQEEEKVGLTEEMIREQSSAYQKASPIYHNNARIVTIREKMTPSSKLSSSRKSVRQ